MNKIFVALGFIALVITCTFAAREPLSLVFIIATFIIIGFGFGKIGEKAAFNSRLTQAERRNFTILRRWFLAVSLAANVGFLFWVNSQTPIFGDAYAKESNMKT
ncbi:hypothetical protein [Enterobacter roggenkampii]|uniref:hypothetical protein n=1 Tax=Enterobacter roggenkampii TaxID=1812935 RepID=UPI002542DC08|nr:hypothetical protein [Enterobacter roggenkampii]WIJ78696.1 hypothetical protein OI980_24530 [Enterobacter roggenkampii]